MNILTNLIDFILHIDQHLVTISQDYGMWSYVILFTIIFVETGLVVMPLLPGDSLLFAAGTLAAQGAFNIHILAILLIIAAIIGDTVNYWVGRIFGKRLFANLDSKIFRQDYLCYTERFYARHGGKTIIIARFMPIVRTFAPFVAGVGHMHYRRFILYNVVGAIIWVTSFLYVSYWFGNLAFIKNNFNLVLWSIIVLSIMPAIIGALKNSLRSS